MPHVDYTTTLLDLEYAEIENIEQNQNSTIVSFHLKRRPHHCLHCNTLTESVHDYRTQYVKDIPVLGRPLIWKYRKLRYHCPCCGKHLPCLKTGNLTFSTPLIFSSPMLLPKGSTIPSRFLKEPVLGIAILLISEKEFS